MQRFSPIITGASGMVGRAVLLECLEHPAVERVLMLNRSPVALSHPKLTEVLLEDFTDISPVREQLRGYDACFFCAGVSSVGMTEVEYTRLTYSLVTSFALSLHALSPAMVFTYVSGTGTDRSESGRIMWARVKGRTENALLAMGFRDAYMFRLGVMLPDSNVEAKAGWVNTMYKLMRPLYPVFKRFSWATTSSRMGKAMINSVLHPQSNKIITNLEINRLAAIR